MRKYAMVMYLDLMEKQENLVEANLYGNENQIIDALTFNSKEVKENTLFICKGMYFKEDYLVDAIHTGAICYISEKKYDLEKDVPYMIVKDIRKAMSALGNMFYNSAWKDLKVIGVGGTKGKSTTVYYIKAIIDDYLEAIGKKESGLMSTIDIYDGVIREEARNTTPEAIEVQSHFRNALDSGIEFVEMEVSSQALKYGRVDDMTFDVSVFLNISEDHISPIEHTDFEDYFASKLSIFNQTKVAVVNLDADFSDRILSEANSCEKVLTFSTQDETADFYAYQIHKKGNSILFGVRSASFNEEFELTMPGLFNVENALAAIAVATHFNIPLEYMHSGLKRARSNGRMELYSSHDDKVVAVVDYAHNKLSFEKLFSSVKQEYPDRDIITVFGCPGKKALVRRRDLGTIAGMYSKKVYITAEDPGYEPFEEICEDIAQYLIAQDCPYEMIEDRGEAIKAAIDSVKNKTIILITGKGNETRQRYGSEYIECLADATNVKIHLKNYNDKKLKEVIKEEVNV